MMKELLKAQLNQPIRICIFMLERRLKKDDFIAIVNPSELRVYTVESYLIFDDGNGFQ